MRILVAIAGLALIMLVAREAFETVVLPRRVASRIRLVSLYYLVTRRVWLIVGRRVRLGAAREDILSYFGPLSLLSLLVLWALLFVVGFAALSWGLALPLAAPDKTIGFATYLYVSGSTFFTLGPGDVVLTSGPGRFLEVLEVALGFGFLALMVGYVPVIYQAFSRRELRISLLDARAGSPANAVGMLRRNCAISDVDGLQRMLNEWEPWCADILESHLSYPVLAFYRSQHERQSWVEALTVILDVCALILTGIEGIPVEPAKFVFAIARHTAVDLAQVFGSPPMTGADRLPEREFARLRDALAGAGLFLREGAAAEGKLAEIRATYEPFVRALADNLLLSLPPWIDVDDGLDDWQTSAWDGHMPSTRQALLDIMR